jgi:hypothetical protein
MHQASLQELNAVKWVCVGADHDEGDDQPGQSFLHELNRVKRVSGGAGHEEGDQPASSLLHT